MFAKVYAFLNKPIQLWPEKAVPTHCWICNGANNETHQNDWECIVVLRKRLHALEVANAKQAEQLKRFEVYFPALR